MEASYFSSLLCDDALLAHDDPATPVDVRVEKLTAKPGSELPAAPVRLVLGEDLDYAEQRVQLEEWRRRAVEAEAEAEALRRELQALQS